MGIVINEYHNAEMKSLPALTEIVVKCRSFLWALPIAASLAGLPFALKADVERVKLWTMVVILLTFIHASMMSVALFSPFMRTICRLN